MLTITYSGEPLELDIDYTPGHPGRYYGPPEFCYPEEFPELEINAIYYKGVDVTCLLCDLNDQLTEIAMSTISAAEDRDYGPEDLD